jgi:hypothetical protein
MSIEAKTGTSFVCCFRDFFAQLGLILEQPTSFKVDSAAISPPFAEHL